MTVATYMYLNILKSCTTKSKWCQVYWRNATCHAMKPKQSAIAYVAMEMRNTKSVNNWAISSKLFKTWREEKHSLPLLWKPTTLSGRVKQSVLSKKLRIFHALVEPVYTSNAHLWTLDATKRGNINAFQRKLYRIVLDIKWPRKISSAKLKDIVWSVNWTFKIDMSRLRWIGHLFRLPKNSPAAIALEEAEREVKRPRGRRKNTWITNAKSQLHEMLNLTWDEAQVEAEDRKHWRELIESIVWYIYFQLLLQEPLKSLLHEKWLFDFFWILLKF